MITYLIDKCIILGQCFIKLTISVNLDVVFDAALRELEVMP